jgi:hemolysin activation/secretion protein
LQPQRFASSLLVGLLGWPLTLPAAPAVATLAANTEPPRTSAGGVVPTPAELAPPPPPRAGASALPERPPAARELGKPEDELQIDVARFVVDDAAPAALRDALPQLTAGFVGKGRGFEDLVNAANEVTRFLQRDLGYYLGYAYIPEQAMGEVPGQGKLVRIAVLEGRLDRVMLNWSDKLPVQREVVQAYLDKLKPGAILTVKDVERTVFLINDLRGITVKAEVRAGSQPGTAILEFTPKADPRYSGSVDLDMNGSRFIGSQRVGGQVTMGSPLGRGDGLSASLLSSISGGLHFALLGYTSPVGADGFKAGMSLSALQYKLSQSEFPLGLDGTGATVNLFGLYPWVRSRNLNLFVLGASNLKTYTDNVASLSTRKQVADLTLGLSGDFRDSLLTGAVNTFEVNLSGGKLQFPGGTPSGLDDATQYAKFNLGFSRLQNVIDGRLLLYITGRGQIALHNLDTTEQFRAGGTDGVRAFAPGEGTGDSGAVATVELRWLPPQSLFGQWAREMVLAAFFDGAYVQFRHNPNLTVRDANYVNHAALAGAGLSLVWARPGKYALRVSLATPTQGQAKSDTVVRNPRLYAQGSWMF